MPALPSFLPSFPTMLSCSCASPPSRSSSAKITRTLSHFLLLFLFLHFLSIFRITVLRSLQRDRRCTIKPPLHYSLSVSNSRDACRKAMEVTEATMETNAPSGTVKTGAPRRKVIIDTDPGIDDMMAIFMAFQAPEIEVIGLTTIFGNVGTELATINALHLCEMAGFPDIPVAEGPSESEQRVKPRIAYFVHGSDGLGETHQAKPEGQKIPISAADFLVEKVAEFPSEVTVVALGPLTNIALAIRKDPGFAKNIGQLVVLGGAFNACGNVNPAAEANIFGDPEAADLVFTAGLNTLAIGINLTTQVVFSEQDLCEIRDSGGKYGQYVYDCCRFYHKWHIDSDLFDGIFLHDPTCMAALLDPSLFTFRKGAVRVETQGRCVGHTLLDYGVKNWVGDNPWIGVPPIDVGITVDVDGVRKLVKKYLCNS